MFNIYKAFSTQLELHAGFFGFHSG
ncbi:uncharacterized protein METZ01_LOCUS404625, partial [marine metagenome]